MGKKKKKSNNNETRRFKTSEVNKRVSNKASSETQVVGVVKENNKSKKPGKKNKDKFRNRHPRVTTIIKISIIAIVLIGIIATGVLAGTFFRGFWR